MTQRRFYRPFYVARTVLDDVAGTDINRVTLYGPDELEFVLIELGEGRVVEQVQRCEALAAWLNEIWWRQRAKDERVA